MEETQRGFISLIVAIALGLAAIGGSVAFMVAYQNVGRNGTSITNSSIAQTAAAAASDVATTSDAVPKETVVRSDTTLQAAAEAKQNEAPLAYAPPVQMGGSSGFGSVNVELTEERSQPAVPYPTTAQMAGVLLLCTDTRIAHICNQTFWDGYMSNVLFRNEVDVLVIQYQHQNDQARLAAQLQQKNCAVWMDAISPLLAGMGPEASANAQKSSMAACSGEDYDDTAYQLSKIKDDVEDLEDIVCPLESNDINCQLMH